MCTAPEHRRLGYGAHMLTAAEHLTRVTAYRKIYLHNRRVVGCAACCAFACSDDAVFICRQLCGAPLDICWGLMGDLRPDLNFVWTPVLMRIQDKGQARDSPVSKPGVSVHQAGLHTVGVVGSGPQARDLPNSHVTSSVADAN